ncbi:MAG: SRPBCC family protein [Flavobacteriales bacterium]|nr:SRPBCC family protein [Flavobacteriales bacterium]
MKLETPFTEIGHSGEKVFSTVNDVERFREFMPSAVSNFKCGEDFNLPWFAFTIGGMPEIKMVRQSFTVPSQVVYSTPMGAKVSLIVNIKTVDDTHCAVQVVIDADVNPMLRMMVERPLRSFLDDVTKKIKAVE